MGYLLIIDLECFLTKDSDIHFGDQIKYKNSEYRLGWNIIDQNIIDGQKVALLIRIIFSYMRKISSQFLGIPIFLTSTIVLFFILLSNLPKKMFHLSLSDGLSRE